MARQRLGVVLLVPQPLATEIDGVRRALGDGALDRIAPHITLVPPVNVAERDLPRAFTLVRTAAVDHRTAHAADRAGGDVRAGEPGRLPPGGRRAAGGRGARAAAHVVPPGTARPAVGARVRPPRHRRRTSWPRTGSTRSTKLLSDFVGRDDDRSGARARRAAGSGVEARRRRAARRAAGGRSAGGACRWSSPSPGRPDVEAAALLSFEEDDAPACRSR